jgi:hypothetical protein
MMIDMYVFVVDAITSCKHMCSSMINRYTQTSVTNFVAFSVLKLRQQLVICYFEDYGLE